MIINNSIFGVIMSKTAHVHLRPNMSLFIPSVTATTSQAQVKRVFDNLNIGVVSRVDFVEKEQDSCKFMAFIHFDYWYVTDTSYYLQEKILEEGQGKIVYNDPYYWIVRENKNPRSLCEIQLEKEVDDLKKRVAYLETVIGNHTRKFMDNDITTTKVYCGECTTEMENETPNCKACGFIAKMDQEWTSEFWKNMEKDSNLNWCDMEDTEDDDEEQHEYVEDLGAGSQDEEDEELGAGSQDEEEEEELGAGSQDEGMGAGSQQSGWFWW